MDKVAYYEELIMEKIGVAKWDRDEVWNNLSPQEQQKLRMMGLAKRKQSIARINANAKEIRDKNGAILVQSKYPALKTNNMDNISVRDAIGYIKDGVSAHRKAGYGVLLSALQGLGNSGNEAYSIRPKKEGGTIVNVVSNNNARDTAVGSNDKNISSILYGKKKKRNQEHASALGKLHEAFEAIKQRKPSEYVALVNRNPYNKEKNANRYDIDNMYSVSSHQDISVPINESKLISRMPDKHPVKRHYVGMRTRSGEVDEYKGYGFNYGKDSVTSKKQMDEIKKSVKDAKLKQGYVPASNKFEAIKMIAKRNKNEREMLKQDKKMIGTGFLI